MKTAYKTTQSTGIYNRSHTAPRDLGVCETFEIAIGTEQATTNLLTDPTTTAAEKAAFASATHSVDVADASTRPMRQTELLRSTPE